MFEQAQFSGIVLCYGPLVLVIVGFIAFAILGDMNARVTYLRRLDPRADEEVTEVEPVTVTQETRAQTPAGMVVKIQPEESDSA